MINVLIVHQDANPRSGGGHSLQELITQALPQADLTGIRFLLAPASLVNRNTADKITQAYNLDLVWYLFPERNVFEIPCISTIWDLGHRELPNFPEFSRSGWSYQSREEIYRSMATAYRIFTGSKFLKKDIAFAYGIEHTRIIVNPFPAPTARIDIERTATSKERTQQPFLLVYPAQFWPHKNHITLIDAIGILKLQRPFENYQLWLTGADKGNEEYVKGYVVSNGLKDCVHFLGFVGVDKLMEMYQQAFALVYPSLLGPDNLPPLEAMSQGCPVATANVRGAREIYGDAVVYFDPLSANEIVKSINSLHGAVNRQRLVKNGYDLTYKRQVSNYINVALQAIRLFGLQRRLFRIQ